MYLTGWTSFSRKSDHERLIASLRARLPKAELIDTRAAFSSSVERRERWPEIRSTISLLVFLTAPDGTIGRGVWREIEYCLRLRIPVARISESGRLVFADGLCFRFPTDGTYWCFASVEESEPARPLRPWRPRWAW